MLRNRFAVKCGAKVLFFFSSSKFFRAFFRYGRISSPRCWCWQAFSVAPFGFVFQVKLWGRWALLFRVVCEDVAKKGAVVVRWLWHLW